VSLINHVWQKGLIYSERLAMHDLRT